MLVSVETSGALERRMKVQVPAQQIDAQIDERLKRVGRTARMEGFRPGRVPAKVIRKRYGPQVRQEVISELMQSSYAEAIQQEQLVPASSPSIEAEEVAEGKDFTYTAVFEVFPEVTLKDLDKIEVRIPEVEIADADIDRMLESLREQRASWEPVDRAAAEGDQALVDFDGFLDGEPIENGSGKNVPVVLGGGQMLPDFDKGLAGAKSGEERTFDVSYPDDYPAEDLAGKTAEFKAHVQTVSEKVLPEIDEDFVKGFGVESGDLAQLRQEASENMAVELATKRRADIKQQVLDQLLTLNPLEVPQSLVKEEAHTMQHEAMRQLGVTDHADAPPAENFLPGAERRVQVSLLVQAFIRQAGITVERDRVEAKMRELFAGYDDSDGMVANYLSDPKFLQQIEPMVLEDQAIEALRAKGTDQLEKIAFKDYMDAR
ncbi:MAG: trigger factor [Pseudomonadota bacterium]